MVATVPQIGSSVASATPGTTISADLISAGTNVRGVLITSFFMSALGTTFGGYTMSFVINGTTYATLVAAKLAGASLAVGGLCSIIVPAGQAIGYSGIVDTTSNGSIQISYTLL